MRLQTADCPQGVELPVDVLAAPRQDPVQYLIHCIATGAPVEGPLSLDICRIGQQVVDTACRSAEQKRTLPLIE